MHRILFTITLPFIGSIDIYTYGVMVVLSFILALTWAIKYSRPKDVNSEQVMDLSIFILIFGIIGARVVHVMVSYRDYSIYDPLTIINIRKGGLAWYGAVLGGILVGIIYSRISKINFWKLADIYGAPGMIGLAIGRIGCFFNGCCYGLPTKLPWGIVFPNSYPPGLQRHPTQIYESLLDLLVFYILYKIDKKKKFHGETFCYFIGLYSLVRFSVEFLRMNFSSIHPIIGLNIAQITSLALILIAFLVGMKLSKIPMDIPSEEKDAIGNK